jgi:hypothetical protein
MNLAFKIAFLMSRTRIYKNQFTRKSSKQFFSLVAIIEQFNLNIIGL